MKASRLLHFLRTSNLLPEWASIAPLTLIRLLPALHKSVIVTATVLVLGVDVRRLSKQIYENSARHAKMVANLPVAMGLFSCAIADAILYDHISLRRPSPYLIGAPHITESAPVAFSWIPGLMVPSSSIPEHSTRAESPVTAWSFILTQLTCTERAYLIEYEDILYQGPMQYYCTMKRDFRVQFVLKRDNKFGTTTTQIFKCSEKNLNGN